MSESEQLLVGKQQNEGVEESKADFGSEFLKYLPMAVYELVGIFFFVTCITYTMGDVTKFIFGFWVVLVFFGPYSGGHVNPAVTLGFYIYDGIKKGNWGFGLLKLALYWIAQVIGSALASKVSQWLLHKDVFVGVPSQSTTFEVFFAEFLFTGTFLFVILFICSDVTGLKNSNGAINCAVIVGWFYCVAQMGAKLSGSAFNPAILFTLNGWDYLNGNKKALEFVSYMVLAEFIGAAVFAVFFTFIFEKTYPRPAEEKKAEVTK